MALICHIDHLKGKTRKTVQKTASRTVGASSMSSGTGIVAATRLVGSASSGEAGPFREAPLAPIKEDQESLYCGVILISS